LFEAIPAISLYTKAAHFTLRVI